MIVSPLQPAIHAAAQALAQGQVLGLPTETVYGLAANAQDPQAVARIYALKDRPSTHPLIVHLAPQHTIGYWARSVPTYATHLMRTFWPGPLTLILPRTAHALDCVTGGQDSVGLRCPSHPVAQAVLQLAQTMGVYGVAAPSANRYGRVSPTTAAHVETEFDPAPLILNGGASEVGIESTIVDCTQSSPSILRHGMVSLEQVAKATSMAVIDAVGQGHVPRVSGSMLAHYAPNTPVQWCPLSQLHQLPLGTVYMAWQVAQPCPDGLAIVRMPNNAHAYAKQLYATLRGLDTMGYHTIAVQPLPDTPDWAGVTDRLQRAAASFAR